VSGRLDAVNAWLDTLRQLDPAAPLAGDVSLSPAGLRAVWEAALAALTPDALHAACALAGRPFRQATVVVARTVVTAPLEWCAVLLARGTRVQLKVPAEAPAVGQLLARTAAAHGLPLTATTRREAVAGDLVVAMGRDATVDEVRRALPSGVRYLGFGHRYSVAWAPSHEALVEVATQVAMHDTRGCRSPVAVFSPVPDAVARLAGAMERAEARWPRGALSPHELAAIRARGALARVEGEVKEGTGWGVWRLPIARFRPEALPRVAVVHPGGADELVAAVWPTRAHLSVVGVPDPTSAPPALGPLADHLAPLGQMQRPPLRRLHDGVDWVAATVQPTGSRAG